MLWNSASKHLDVPPWEAGAGPDAHASCNVCSWSQTHSPQPSPGSSQSPAASCHHDPYLWQMPHSTWKAMSAAGRDRTANSPQGLVLRSGPCWLARGSQSVGGEKQWGPADPEYLCPVQGRKETDWVLNRWSKLFPSQQWTMFSKNGDYSSLLLLF